MLNFRACVVPYFGKETGCLDWPKAVPEGSAELWKYFGKAAPKWAGGMVWVLVKMQHHVSWDLLLKMLHPLLMD